MFTCFFEKPFFFNKIFCTFAEKERSFDLMQNKVEYRTSLVPKSLPIKQIAFANC